MAKQRRREELYVTVPTLFRCPISMDVMRSPVSLCTGVTYDRTSIEKWLALGHKTCPATMQTLPSTHTTPNLTLRRLIHLWLAHADIVPASISNFPSVISKQQAADIVVNLEFNSDSLAKLIGFLKSSEENLRFIAESSDSIARFVEFLVKSSEVRISEMIVEVLDLLLPVNGMVEKLSDLILRSGDDDCLPPLVTVLQKGKTDSKIKSTKLIESIAVTPESQRKIAEKPEVLQELYNLSTSPSSSAAVEAGLSALTAISISRPAKKELLRLGIVGSIERILSSNAVEGVIIEKALSLLELIATCTEGRTAIGEEAECTVEIVRRLMKCSSAAREHGITVVWSVCCMARDAKVQDMIARANGLTKVLLVMQSDCSPSTRQMCADLVKVLRPKNGKSNLATTHITPY